MKIVEPIRDRKKIELMKKILRGGGVRDYALFVLGINSGLRISDILKLKVGDVAEADGTVRERMSLREKKTGKAKDFPLSKNVREALCEHLNGFGDGDHHPDDPLFPSRKGFGPITKGQAWRVLAAAARAAGVEHIGTHTMRKTFGYHSFKMGHDLSQIQSLLNHSSQKETLRYIGITKDQLDKVYETVNL
jgi:integrase